MTATPPDITSSELDEIQRWAESHEHNDESTTVAATYLRLVAAVRARDAEIEQRKADAKDAARREREMTENWATATNRAIAATDRATIPEARAARYREALEEIVSYEACAASSGAAGGIAEEALAADEREGTP